MEVGAGARGDGRLTAGAPRAGMMPTRDGQVARGTVGGAMAHATVTDMTSNRFRITSSGAFIARFTQTLAETETASFVIRQPHTPFMPGHTVGPVGQDPVNLLHVPTEEGHSFGDYRIAVSLVRLDGDLVDLTCVITRAATGTDTSRWEICGTRDDLVTWDLSFASTTVDYLVADPRAELSASRGQTDGSIQLSAADPRGTEKEPTVFGALPPELAPRVSFVAVDAAPIAGLPLCAPDGELMASIPSAGLPSVPLTVAVRATFGGTCPLNTAYLETTSEPVEVPRH